MSKTKIRIGGIFARRYIFLGCLFILFGTSLSQCIDVDDNIVPGQYYKLISKYSDKCLDVSDPSKTNSGINIHQWEYLGLDNQKFLLIPVDDGEYYAIIAKYSGRCIDVLDPSRTDNGIDIHQWEYLGLDNQKWRLEPDSDGYFTIISKHSQKCIDVSDPSIPDNGTNIHQWEYLGLDNQKWDIEPVDDKITLPPLHKPYAHYGEIREDIPELNSYGGNLKKTTPLRLISEVYIPFIYITDTSYPDPKDKIKKSPFYVLKLEQFWELENDKTVPGTSEHDVEFTYKKGSSTKDFDSMETTLGNSLAIELQNGATFSEKYEPKNVELSGGASGASFGIKTSGGQSTSHELTNSHVYKQADESREVVTRGTEKTMNFEEEVRDKKHYTKGEKIREAQYVLVDKFTLLRMDGTEVKSWEIKTDTSDIVSYVENLKIN